MKTKQWQSTFFLRVAVITTVFLTFLVSSLPARTVKGLQDNAVSTEQSAATELQAITILNSKVAGDALIVTGKTTVDPKVSTYIQYYIGKIHNGTLSTCILCDGFNTTADGSFTLTLPVTKLKGPGNYTVVLEQNPKADTILPPKHWLAFFKTDKGIAFGDITSMDEIANLALTVGMKTAAATVTVPGSTIKNNKIHIETVTAGSDSLVVDGRTDIDPAISDYIQFYIGKNYPDTLSQCILCDGFQAGTDGRFHAEIAAAKLKGAGDYTIVLEQNPKASGILPPEHWQAFRKTEQGLEFGDITAMGEIANLALTVGMQTASADFTFGERKESNPALVIEETRQENGQVIISGKSAIPAEASSYIQYYIGKEFDGTVSNCVLSAGFNTDAAGQFTLSVPVEKLKGPGTYTIVLEQNPKSNKIIGPKHWMAFYREDGKLAFGDISAMKELSNLALTVGMEIAETVLTIQ